MNSSMMLWFDAITESIGGMLYGLFGSLFCKFIDWIQAIFRSLAGLGPIKIDGQTYGTDGEKYDIVFYLLQTDIVQDIFFSMVTFSLILMFLMTGLAIIRNSYQDKPKPIGDIIMNVFKGLLGMILIPIACMAGLMFGNVILQAVDAGTTSNGITTASGNLFLSAAYDANICRDGNYGDKDAIKRRVENFKELLDHTDIEAYLGSVGASDLVMQVVNGTCDAEEWELLADHIDTAFASGQITYDGGDVLDPYDTWKVQTCYNLFDVNYIIFIVGGCLMVGFLFKMCFGMVGRIFKLTFDFVLIPVVMAMMPFDSGTAAKSWKGDFVKNVVVAYSTVGALNLYYSILPVINKIEFSGESFAGGGLFSGVLKLVLSIVGLFSANAIVSSVGGWFQTGDLLAEGKNVYGTFTDGLKKVTDKTKSVGGKVGGTVTGAFAGMRKAREAGGHGVSGFFAGAYGGSGLKGFVDKGLPKGFGDARKAGEEAYDKARQFGFTDAMRKNRTAEYQGHLKQHEHAEKRGEIMRAWANGEYGTGADATKERDDRLKALEEEFLANYEANGGMYTYTRDDGTVRSFSAKSELARKARIEKGATKKESSNNALEQHLKIMQRERATLNNALSAGVDGALAANYLTDRTTDITALTDAQKELMYAAAEAYDAYQEVDRAATLLSAIKAGDSAATYNINGEAVSAGKVTIQQLRQLMSTDLAQFDAYYSNLHLYSSSIDQLNSDIANNRNNIEQLKQEAEDIEKDVKGARTQFATNPQSITDEQWRNLGKEPKNK